MTAEFLEFKETLQNNDMLKWSLGQFNDFIRQNQYFLEKLRINRNDQIDLLLFEKRIQDCYIKLLNCFESHQDSQDFKYLKQIVSCWPIENENSLLKTKVLSLCLQDFPNKVLKAVDYIRFVKRVKEALLFLKSLEPILTCDLLTVNSLLVSLKGYNFELEEFNSLEVLESHSKLFQGSILVYKNITIFLKYFITILVYQLENLFIIYKPNH